MCNEEAVKKYEVLGRYITTSTITTANPNCTFTVSDYIYSPYDIVFNFNGDEKRYITEVKTRKEFYSDFILEVEKYEGLQKVKKTNDCVLYACVCLENSTLYIWDITDVESIKGGKRRFHWCADETTGDNTKVLKDCYFLPVNQANRTYNISGILKEIKDAHN